MKKVLTTISLSLAMLLLACGDNSGKGDSKKVGNDPTNHSSSSVHETPSIPEGEVIFQVEDSGVDVTFSLAKGEGSKRWLKAKFSPTEKGYHLYSMDLPLEGIDGIGRPTLLELSKHEAISGLGKLTADKKVHNLTSPLNADGFPVYPDGPVTLTLPFSLKAESNATIEVEAKITYMACTKTSCNPPVEGKTVMLSLK